MSWSAPDGKPSEYPGQSEIEYFSPLMLHSERKFSKLIALATILFSISEMDILILLALQFSPFQGQDMSSWDTAKDI